MGLASGGFPLLGGVVVLLLAVGGSGSSSSPHSLHYFYTALSEPSQGLPHFISVGFVDDQPFVRYDSSSGRAGPLVPWMEKAVKDQPEYWEGESDKSRHADSAFRASLEILRERYNQSQGGLHTLQMMYGCEVGPDRRLSGGHMQDAYDGEDFLALDIKTHTWTARVPQALETKRKWESEAEETLRWEIYLEETCAPWLRRYLDYGQEALLRTEAPRGRVSRKKVDNDQETLICRLDGFYPKEIDVTWQKDGEVWHQGTLTGGVVPNSDGTYHTWLSIEVDPKERDRYRCRVEHDSLREALELAWKDPASNWGLILGILGGLLAALALVGAGVVCYYRKKQQEKEGYKAPSVPVPA